MTAKLTVANSVIAVTIEALYPAAEILTGYAADDAFTTEAVQNGEYSMGIDGKLSAGFVFYEVPLAITLQADSDSIAVFENVWLYETNNRTKLEWNVTITLPSLQRRYDYKTGYLETYKAPSGQKILQPVAAQLVFSRMDMSPL